MVNFFFFLHLNSTGKTTTKNYGKNEIWKYYIQRMINLH